MTILAFIEFLEKEEAASVVGSSVGTGQFWSVNAARLFGGNFTTPQFRASALLFSQEQSN
ncbi:MAG TPA: hypothetical protein VJI33_01120 [Candidatus Paceibacterota bacterium]